MIAQGSVADVVTAPGSRIAPFLRDGGKIHERVRPQIDLDAMFAKGRIHLETNTVHTVHPLSVDVPRGRLTVVTGVSGSGKTTMVLETLVPALRSSIGGAALPASARSIDAEGVSKVELIDATPIGSNIRSTVATYCGIHDDLRRASRRPTVPANVASGPARSRTIRADCVAPPAMAPVRSRWMFSFFPTSMSNVPTAGGRVMRMRPMASVWNARMASRARCRSSWR